MYSDSSNCTFIDPTPGARCSVENTTFEYVPTLWVNALFLALYCVIFPALLVLSLWPKQVRKGGFVLLAAVCSAGEIAGWASRVNAHSNPFADDPYISQMVCLILSPVFSSACVYMCLEALAHTTGTDMARLQKKVYISVFCTGDVICLVVQAVGGGMSATANDPDSINEGGHISLGGVSLQVFVTGGFLLMLLDFLWRHWKLYQRTTEQDVDHYRWTRKTVWVAGTCLVSTCFILIRCIYRIVEMADNGWTGHLQTTEAFFPIFDGLPILIANLCFVFIHPGFWLPDAWSKRQQEFFSLPLPGTYNTKEHTPSIVSSRTPNEV